MGVVYDSYIRLCKSPVAHLGIKPTIMNSWWFLAFIIVLDILTSVIATVFRSSVVVGT